jgi:GT2 family glycosyltransferase
LIEKPPRFGSKRFREIVVPAFKGDPATALSGLYFMATRRRIRGWSRLMLAASQAPLNYARWTRHGEVRAFAEFCRVHRQSQDAPPIVALLLDSDASGEAVDVSLKSIRAALSDPVFYSAADRSGLQPLPRSDSLLGMLTALVELHGTAWLLPVKAGDRVSALLGDVLARSLRTGDESLVYWDEDHLRAGRRCDPWVKPDWDPLLFGALGGLLGASVLSLAAIKSFSASLSDSPIHEASFERLLRDVGSIARPKHIPLILSHRAQASGTKRAAASTPPAPANWPGVSIIVPTRDKPVLLAACLSGIGRIDYPGPIQTIVVDNGSRDPVALELLERVEKEPRALVLRDEEPFNFSRLNNLAARAAQGEILCLLNNDVEPFDNDWLTTLVRYAVHEGVGAVGPQLVYPSGRIQHAGVVVGIGGAAGHVQKGLEPSERSFWTWHAVTRETSALTAAVLVVKKSVFHEVGGFDEAFAVAFNDVDFCLRLRELGLRNIYVADVRLLHRESESRGKDRSPAQAQRFAGELARLQARWETEHYSDPHFSPLFSGLVERCILAP